MPIEQVEVNRQRARRAVVRADERFWMRTGIDNRMQTKLVCNQCGLGTLKEDRIYFAPQQPDQFRIAVACAASREQLRTRDALGGFIAIPAVDCKVHEFDIGHFKSFQLQCIFKAANGLGTCEVNLHVRPFWQTESATLQIARCLDAGIGQRQDQLNFVCP
jgi:hypothetical protein